MLPRTRVAPRSPCTNRTCTDPLDTSPVISAPKFTSGGRRNMGIPPTGRDSDRAGRRMLSAPAGGTHGIRPADYFLGAVDGGGGAGTFGGAGGGLGLKPPFLISSRRPGDGFGAGGDEGLFCSDMRFTLGE
jgi:hypothetical protein